MSVIHQKLNMNSPVTLLFFGFYCRHTSLQLKHRKTLSKGNAMTMSLFSLIGISPKLLGQESI